NDDIVALAGQGIGTEAAANAPIDSAALTIGMAYDAAGGRPMFDLRSGALAVKVDLSFLRAKAVPLGAAAIVILMFAAVSAYADLYRLRKSEKALTARLQEETTAYFGGPKGVDDIVGTKGAGGRLAGASPIPKMSAYDIMLEISNKVPARDKIQLDIQRMSIASDKIELNGTVKTPEEIDALVTELKKIECFKGVERGPMETDNGLKRFS